MATTIEQQVALDEALVPSIKRLRIRRSNFRLPSDIQSKEPTLQVVYDILRGCPFFKAFLVTADVPAIYMQEFWATTYLHQHSIRFKMDSKKNIKPSIPRRNKVNWHYVRDDILFSTIKVVSRHQNTQQYGAILPIELTTEDIRNTKAYKEYYACATEEAAPKPKASTRRKIGGSNSSTTPPTAVASPRPITTVAAAPRLTATAKGKQPARATTPYDPSEMKELVPGVLDVPSDDSDEEISWNSSDDEDVNAQDKGRDDNEGKTNDKSDDGKDDDDDDQDDTERDDDDDDEDDEEEISKLDEQEDTESGEGDAEETKSDEE
nr:hypothetical protein [Tanacetum cinerariifolium]